MSQPAKPHSREADGLPFVFVDRSLGRLKVPALLRAAGLQLITLAEHYGMPADEDVDDVQWIREAASRGWPSFMKDAAIRRRPAERQAILASGAQCFCLANANLNAEDSANRYISNFARIARACREPGPFLYAVHVGRIERVAMTS